MQTTLVSVVIMLFALTIAIAEVKTLKHVNNSVELDGLQTIYNWSNMCIDSIYCIQSYLALYNIRFMS